MGICWNVPSLIPRPLPDLIAAWEQGQLQPRYVPLLGQVTSLKVRWKLQIGQNSQIWLPLTPTFHVQTLCNTAHERKVARYCVTISSGKNAQ